MKTTDRMEREVQRMATSIIGDLGLNKNSFMPTFETAWKLCERHGTSPEAMPVFPPQLLGWYVHRTGDTDRYGPNETIYINGALSMNEAAAVIIHELTHRMAHGSRYKEDIQRLDAAIDLRSFHEKVAMAVENHWRREADELIGQMRAHVAEWRDVRRQALNANPTHVSFNHRQTMAFADNRGGNQEGPSEH